MFVDASAIVSILLQEDDHEALADRFDRSNGVFVSALVLWEVMLALTRERRLSFDAAQEALDSFMRDNEIAVLDITAPIGQLAIDAARRFGRGRHPAGLNFGDCFAYACAQALGLPLLFKGDDFARTDIAAA
jgi:ribonuclease VapC